LAAELRAVLAELGEKEREAVEAAALAGRRAKRQREGNWVQQER
jgi:hypothetical protein